MLKIPQNELISGPVKLGLIKIVSEDFERGLSPYYHFRIMNFSGQQTGTINFRIGDTEHILKAAGHVGYYIFPEFRGYKYSFHACKALIPLISKFYSEVILTVDPENKPSIAVIETLNAEYIETVDIPKHDPAYKGVPLKKRRYLWRVTDSI